jgi:hypothetical protein
MNEKLYPSDLTDEEWDSIKELIPDAKPGGLATLLADPFPVIITQVEVAREFVGRERSRVTAIPFPLSGGQKADRHVLFCRKCMATVRCGGMLKNEVFWNCFVN